MIKHTIEIARQPAQLRLQRKQLIIRLSDDEKEKNYPCEDIGVLILQHPSISLTAALLNALLEEGAVIIICDQKHLPSGMLLPTVTHTELVPRLTAQLNADLPARKQAWKAIVEAKITQQAQPLEGAAKLKLQKLQKNVKSGDLENAEAQAAKIYWPARFPKIYQAGDKRDPESLSLFNSLLNYGYAIIRAATARSLVSAGLQPALGVFHHRRNNPFCLADDVMEPLRPLVDTTIADILKDDNQASSSSPRSSSLTSQHRQKLLSLLTHTVSINGQTGPLMATLPKYINHFYRVLTKEQSRLEWPRY